MLIVLYHFDTDYFELVTDFWRTVKLKLGKSV